MRPEEQVTSLELAKKLKALGVKQDALYHWFKPVYEKEFSLCQFDEWQDSKKHEDCYAAFTVGELGILLIKNPVDHFYFYLGKDGNWRCRCENNRPQIKETRAETEADARAQMLIFLLENTPQYPDKIKG